MLATVEAETNGRNVMGDDSGDGPRAFGYGQVWLKWHFAKLEKVAALLNVPLPGPAPKTVAEEVPFRALILGNDRLSMYLAAAAVAGFWTSSGGDFSTFVHAYVGPAVPDRELERRTALLDGWRRSLGATPTAPVPDLVADVPGVARIDRTPGGFSVSSPLGTGLAALVPIGVLFLVVAAILPNKEARS
jgi:hypothetical protein